MVFVSLFQQIAAVCHSNLTKIFLDGVGLLLPESSLTGLREAEAVWQELSPVCLYRGLCQVIPLHTRCWNSVCGNTDRKWYWSTLVLPKDVCTVNILNNLYVIKKDLFNILGRAGLKAR